MSATTATPTIRPASAIAGKNQRRLGSPDWSPSADLSVSSKRFIASVAAASEPRGSEVISTSPGAGSVVVGGGAAAGGSGGAASWGAVASTWRGLEPVERLEHLLGRRRHTIGRQRRRHR